MNATTAAESSIWVPELVIVTANQIKTAAIKWLWPDVIALGMTNLFTGNPDQCKSLMIVDVVARASCGVDWLDGGRNVNGPIDVLMMFNEDPAAHVVVPRLKAAGADLARIHIVQHVKTKEDKVREFAIASDIQQLKQYLETNPSIRLIAIDPFSAYFGSNRKLNDDQTVRDVTAPLIQLAEQTGVAIIDNSHLNKTEGLDAIQKVIGAMAVVAIHRMAWVFTSAENEDDCRERMMLPLKHNITGKAEGLVLAQREMENAPSPFPAEPKQIFLLFNHFSILAREFLL